MNPKLRLTCAAFAAALTACATMPAGPAQAEGKDLAYTRHTTKRTMAKTGTGRVSGDQVASSSTAAAGVTYRIAGSDRIQTAIETSRAAWSDAGTVDGPSPSPWS